MSDDEIERVAIAICLNLGLDPQKSVQASATDVKTPAEIEAMGDFIPGMSLVVARWETYRGQAALAIAMHRAMIEEPTNNE